MTNIGKASVKIVADDSDFLKTLERDFKKYSKLAVEGIMKTSGSFAAGTREGFLGEMATGGANSKTGSSGATSMATGLSGGLGKMVGALGIIGVATKAIAEVAGKILNTLIESSPALKGTFLIFGKAMNLFFKPFGDFLSSLLRPLAIWLLRMAIAFIGYTKQPRKLEDAGQSGEKVQAEVEGIKKSQEELSEAYVKGELTYDEFKLKLIQSQFALSGTTVTMQDLMDASLHADDKTGIYAQTMEDLSGKLIDTSEKTKEADMQSALFGGSMDKLKMKLFGTKDMTKLTGNQMNLLGNEMVAAALDAVKAKDQNILLASSFEELKKKLFGTTDESKLTKDQVILLNIEMTKLKKEIIGNEDKTSTLSDTIGDVSTATGDANTALTTFEKHMKKISGISPSNGGSGSGNGYTPSKPKNIIEIISDFIFGTNQVGNSFIPQDGLYKLHRGEEVISNTSTKNNTGGDSYSFDVNMNNTLSNDYDIDSIADDLVDKVHTKLRERLSYR